MSGAVIRIGIFLNTNYGAGENVAARFREAAEQVRMARDYGFSSVCVGQHFLTEYQKLQPIPVLSRLAAESGDMRLLPGILLLPLFNPVYVAEEIATLDVISGGRVILGLGVGYRDVEFEAFGVQKKERGARFEESLEAIKRLWTEDEVSFEGRFFRIPKAQVRTRPLQRPHPPIWVAAQADAGVRRAARVGDVLFLNPQARIATLREQAELFRRTRQELGRPVPEEMACHKEVFIAPDMDTALREGKPFLEGKLKMYARWGQARELPAASATFVDEGFDDLRKDRVIVGDPEHCVAEFKRYHREVGIDHFSCVLNWPGMQHWQILRSIQLIGERVLPALR
jgi:alkanesulfonate monooxygenase SsuD/methylene tetrahydromethanopterin reductase-like flavin-dependent oxidoreductase (luciferase family)